MPSYLRPIDLARRAGLGPSQIRNYERDGFLPPAARSPAGHRRYGEAHAEALRVSRILITGYGWQMALEAMRAVHRGDRAALYEIVDRCHARLDECRRRIESTLAALDDLRPLVPVPARGYDVGIGAAAARAGVRVSAVRFWDEQGLLHPTRDAAGNRRYDGTQLTRLHVVVLLRAAGYRSTAIRSILDELGADQPEPARQALEAHRASLDEASERAALATATAYAYFRQGDGT